MKKTEAGKFIEFFNSFIEGADKKYKEDIRACLIDSLDYIVTVQDVMHPNNCYASYFLMTDDSVIRVKNYRLREIKKSTWDKVSQLDQY